MKTQTKRFFWRTSFFLLFLFAPILDLFRFDLIQNHFIFLGQPWALGLSAFQTGEITASEMAWNMLLRFFLPLGLIVGGGFFISWKWGRLYCGWLCPHFSVVEIINHLMRHTFGKHSLWSKKKLPEKQKDGTQIKPNKKYWVVTLFAILFFSFVWAVVLLTYLLPPKTIYTNLWHFNLTQNQFTFITIATFLLSIEFTFARHLFCRFGCAIGLFQSLVWMANKKAMVVGFNRQRAKDCASCDNSCEHACPMQLKPRSLKRHMFTCTQCMQCVNACEKVQTLQDEPALLKMLSGSCAFDASARDFGKKPDVPTVCYTKENKNKQCCQK